MIHAHVEAERNINSAAEKMHKEKQELRGLETDCCGFF